jgi:hypothetical protein
MWMTKYISSAAGGGAPGRDAGTAPDIMTAAGELTVFPRLSTKQFPPAGEKITGIAAGKGMRGNTKEYLITSCVKTGEHGMITDTGKEKNHGMFRACNQESIIKKHRLNVDRHNLHAKLKARARMTEEGVKKN